MSKSHASAKELQQLKESCIGNATFHYTEAEVCTKLLCYALVHMCYLLNKHALISFIIFISTLITSYTVIMQVRVIQYIALHYH